MSADKIPILTTTERSTFRRCPWLWQQRFRYGWQPKAQTPNALWFGIGIHLALANWYQGGTLRGPHPADTFESWSEGEFREIRASREEWDDEPKYVDGCKLGVGMMEHYVDHYGDDEEWDILALEQPFNILVKRGGRAVVRYMSRFDGVLRDLTDGRVYLLENKTASQIVTGYLELDDQGGGYFAVASHVLRANGVLKGKESIAGIVYNFMRKAVPDPDKRRNDLGQYLNLDGKVSKRQPAPFFVRTFVERSPKEVSAQFNRISDEVEVMNAMRRREIPITKSTTKDCTWCPFFTPCMLHERGGDDYKEVLRTMYTQQDPYQGYRKSAAVD